MVRTEEIEREAERFYYAYLDRFNRRDVVGYEQCFSLPFAILSGESGLTVFATEADRRRLSNELFTELKSRGWARSEADRVKVWACTENQAIIVADMARYKADGSVLQRGRFCYTSRREANEWKIVSVLAVADGFPGPGNLRR